MADTKITALADLPVPAGVDLFVLVDDVAGTPTTKKATITNVEAVLDHSNILNVGTNSHAQIDTHVGGDGSDHADVATNTAASHAESHAMASHSDDNTYNLSTSGTAATGALTVTGNIVVSGTVDGVDVATDVAANTAHRGDNTQAHSDYLLNSAADAGVGLTLSGDNSSADTAYVPMVLYNTDATPPAASGFPVGTLYVQYTA